jgi:hypothetical protein
MTLDVNDLDGSHGWSRMAGKEKVNEADRLIAGWLVGCSSGMVRSGLDHGGRHVCLRGGTALFEVPIRIRVTTRLFHPLLSEAATLH